jgi:hypothetical protein
MEQTDASWRVLDHTAQIEREVPTMLDALDHLHDMGPHGRAHSAIKHRGREYILTLVESVQSRIDRNPVLGVPHG